MAPQWTALRLLTVGLILLLIFEATLIVLSYPSTLAHTMPNSEDVPKMNSTTTPQNETDMTVALVDYCVGDMYARLKKLVTYNRQVYADTWGYRVRSGNENELPVQSFVEPLAWLKAAYFFQLLSSYRDHDVDWFLWVDCDALVTRFDLSIPQVLDDLGVLPQHHVVLAHDLGAGDFNTGVILVRNSEWSLGLWRRTLLKASDPAIRTHPWWEQQALLELYHENRFDESQHILITADRWKINAFRNQQLHEFNESSFVLHRVFCREQPKCDNLFETFFCATMPKGSFPEGIVDCRIETESI